MVLFGDGNQMSSEAEETLFEINNMTFPKNYHTTLFFTGMVEGDEITFRAYLYNVNGGTYECYYDRPANWQTMNQGKERAIRIPWVTSTNFKVTIEKSLGSNSNVKFYWVQTDVP
jgi:hypothetical protein